MMKISKPEFSQLFSTLRLAYPSLRKTTAVEFNEECDVYFRALGQFKPDLLTECFDAAVNHWPDYFPTAGQLRTAAFAIFRRRNEKQPEQQKLLTDPGVRPAEGATPFERLARQWFDESRELGIRPDSTTPSELAKKRWAQFWEAWDETHTAHLETSA